MHITAAIYAHARTHARTHVQHGMTQSGQPNSQHRWVLSCVSMCCGQFAGGAAANKQQLFFWHSAGLPFKM